MFTNNDLNIVKFEQLNTLFLQKSKHNFQKSIFSVIGVGIMSRHFKLPQPNTFESQKESYGCVLCQQKSVYV